MPDSEREMMRRWVEGRRRAYRVIARERIIALRSMTVAESLAAFCTIYGACRPMSQKDREQLDRQDFEACGRSRRAFRAHAAGQAHE